MRRLIQYAVIIAGLAILFSGCKKYYGISDKQLVLFQMDYMNYAWGFQHNGYYIDNEGNILTYDIPENWNIADNDFMISEDKLIENMNKCTVSENIIPTVELNKFSGYIENIASSKVTAQVNSGADMGSLQFICYLFDENLKSYKGYLIKLEGDYSSENLNFYSKKVVQWLREIKTNLPSE